MKIGDIRISNGVTHFYSRKSNAEIYRVASVHAGNHIRVLGRPSLLARSWAYGETDRGERGFFGIKGTREHFAHPPKAKTKGDVYEAYLHDAYYANPDRENDYIWGAEGDNADHSRSGDPEWDCSGLIHASRRAAGVKDSRTTAEEYRKRGRPITMPTQVGDYGVILRDDGTAHHIVAWMSGGYVIEARGRDYGIERNSMTNLRKRGVRWYRDAKVNAALKEAA